MKSHIVNINELKIAEESFQEIQEIQGSTLIIGSSQILFHHLCWFHFWPAADLSSLWKAFLCFSFHVPQWQRSEKGSLEYKSLFRPAFMKKTTVAFQMQPQSLFWKAWRALRRDIIWYIGWMSSFSSRLPKWMNWVNMFFSRFLTFFGDRFWKGPAGSRCLWGALSAKNIGATPAGHSIRGAPFGIAGFEISSLGILWGQFMKGSQKYWWDFRQGESLGRWAALN